MDFCIVVRSSPDWGAMTQEEFERQSCDFCRRVGWPTDRVVRYARLWQDTFHSAYQETRRDIKRIAQDTLGAWPKLPSVEIGCPQEVRPNTAYLFTDDDDWFAAELPDVLSSHLNQHQAVVWGSAVLRGRMGTAAITTRSAAKTPVVGQPAAILRLFQNHCHSNNYGVTSAYFEREGSAWDRVFEHGSGATEEFRSLRVLNIPRYLSVKNTHPASAAALEVSLRDDFSTGRLRKIVEDYVAGFDQSPVLREPPFSWASAQIEAVRVHFASLLGN